MGQTNRGENEKKFVLRVRIRKPDFSHIAKSAFFAPKNAVVRLINARLRWRMLAAAIVLVLADFYSALFPFFQDNAYALGNGLGLLSDSSQEIAAMVKHDLKEQAFNFEPSNNQSPDLTGKVVRSPAKLYEDAKKGVTVSDPVNKVDFTMVPKFQLNAGRQDKDRVVYPLANGSGWLVYTVKGTGVKEDIILNHVQNDTVSYSYELRLGDTLKAKMEADGSIGIYGNSLFSGNVSTGTEKDAELLKKARENAPKDTFLFNIPKPVVNDKHGPANGITAKYSLDGNNLTVTAKGMKKGNYPITIDPSIYVVTAQQFMAGNNETNVNFDVDNKLIKKGRTTGARFDAWNSTTGLPTAVWGAGTVPTGGYIYSVGGEAITRQLYTSQGAGSFEVPAGVTSITVKAWGGGGGGGGGGSNAAGGAGGGGGYVSNTISVTPSETLNVYVGGGGGAGTGSNNNAGAGGGGGGHSSIYRSSTPLAIAAGGAGGGGGRTTAGHTGGAGGAGGGSTGVTGGTAGGTSTPPLGGTGGSTSGGAAGTGGTNTGTAGTSLNGGLGADGRNSNAGDGSAANGGLATGGDGGSRITNNYAGGGGGGSGWFGGGGGAGTEGTTSGGSGGGGGSSYINGSVGGTAGSGTAPGNSGDADRGGSADGGGGGAADNTGTAGDNGLVLITWGVGGIETTSAISWAQFDTGSGTITNANPGTGACSGWCSTSAYNLPDGRSHFSLVAYNGFLYAMGGRSANCTTGNGTGNNGYCDTVYIAKLGANGEPRLWHPTDTNPNNSVYWYRDTDLSSERSYSGAVAYNNRMYLVGGRTNSGPVSTVQVADIVPNGKLGTWTSTTAFGSNVYNHSVQVYNDRLYVIGGSSTVGGAPTNTVHFNKINSNGTLNSWVQTSSFSTGRASFGGNFSVIWGAYIYVSGGCSSVNASGYCTTMDSTAEVASINADGSLDVWNSMAGLTDSRMGFNLIAWRDNIYAIGGCTSQNTTTGACITAVDLIRYGTVNQDGDASTVGQSSASGAGNCQVAAPTDCNLPGTANIGNMLSAAVITNGHLYVIGGCTNNLCSATQDNVAYVAISSTGVMTKPATCPNGAYQGQAWCVDTVNAVTGGVAASSPVVFGGRIYLVGGLNGTANINDIWRTTPNADGSIGAWTRQDLSGGGAGSAGAANVSYSYAFARANPSSAGTNPGNMYILGGCTTSNDAGCSAYTDDVYKCNILASDGSVSGCSTSGQLQIGVIPGGTNAGLAIMSGTVYAGYIYLIGGVTQDIQDLDTTRYAKIDNSNNIVAVSGSAWIQSPSLMNVGRRRAAAFGYNGYLYMVGGYDAGSGVLPDIEFVKINVSDGSLIGDPSNSNKWNVSGVEINQRWGLSVPVSNSYAYVIGGCTTGASPGGCTVRTDVIQTFQLYNNDSGAPADFVNSANTYSTHANRVGASSAIHNGYIYVAGGCIGAILCGDTTNNVSYAAIDAYGALGSWSSTSANLPADRGWGKLRVAGGSLYYIGGHSDTSTDFRTEVYYGTPSSGNISSWSTASNGLPNARSNFGATVWNDRLYVVGGQGSGTGCTGGVCNTVYVSPQLNSGGNITSAWSTGSTSFNVARSGLVAVAYANNLYVFGGYDGAEYLSDSQFSQISTANGDAGSWSNSASMPHPISQGEGFAANGYVYVAGGKSAAEACEPTIFAAPISANTTIASGNNPTGIGAWYAANEHYSGARFGNTAAYYDGKAYVLGGADCTAEVGTAYSTAGSQSYVVPTGVTSITVKAWGGGGGGGGGGDGNSASGGAGGGGGYTTATLSVTPGETLTISVGGGGGGGVYHTGGNDAGGGGGGGGYSSVFRSATPLALAAGGGGGGGANDDLGGAGGPGGCTSTGTACNGGPGFDSAVGGGGGTTSAGGAGGAGDLASNGTAGTSLTGGAGADGRSSGNSAGGGPLGGTSSGGRGGVANLVGTTFAGGGGGAAGYFGGGGGGASDNNIFFDDRSGAGGGGGSSYTAGGATGVTISTGSGATAGNSGDAYRSGAGDGGAGTTSAGGAGDTGRVVIFDGTITYPATATQQSALLSQPQVAKYSIMMDTDSDVFPTHWLLNGIDNSIGARWQLKYRSMTNPGATIQCASSSMSTWGTETSHGDVTLALPGIFTPRDGSNNNSNCARYYYFNVSVDAQQSFGYPDDVTRGPTITDMTLNFKADPAKRLMHGRTFVGGLQMPDDTPYYAN